MLRFMLKYCINHRQKHIRNTKIPMTALPLAAALVKLSVKMCIRDSYMVDTAKPLSYSAIRSIIGECADVLREVIADTPSGIVITTDTVRVTTSGVQIADAPCATMLADTSATDLRTDGPERYAIRQLAALLYTCLLYTSRCV